MKSKDFSAAFGLSTFEPSSEQKLEILDKLHSSYQLKKESKEQLISYLYAIAKQENNTTDIDREIIYENLEIDISKINLTEACLLFNSLSMLNLENYKEFKKLKDFVISSLYKLDSSNFNLFHQGIMNMNDIPIEDVNSLFNYIFDYKDELAKYMLVQWLHGFYERDLNKEIHEEKIHSLLKYLCVSAPSLNVKDLCYLLWMCVNENLTDFLPVQEIEESIMSQELTWNLEEMLILISSMGYIENVSREFWLHLLYLSSFYKENLNVTSLSEILWSSTTLETISASDLKPLIGELERLAEETDKAQDSKINKNDLLALAYTFVKKEIFHKQMAEWIYTKILKIQREEKLEEIEESLVSNFKKLYDLE